MQNQLAMSLEAKIMEAIKTAMKEKNSVALDALRAIKSQIILEKTSGKGTELSEHQEMAILKRMVKQRRESAELFSKSGREDLAENELAQLRVIEQFLPEQLTPEQLAEEVRKILKEAGISGKENMGKAIGLVNQKLAGRAEGKAIAEAVKEALGV